MNTVKMNSVYAPYIVLILNFEFSYADIRTNSLKQGDGYLSRIYNSSKCVPVTFNGNNIALYRTIRRQRIALCAVLLYKEKALRGFSHLQ
jgi:hypothetical protein